MAALKKFFNENNEDEPFSSACRSSQIELYEVEEKLTKLGKRQICIFKVNTEYFVQVRETRRVPLYRSLTINFVLLFFFHHQHPYTFFFLHSQKFSPKSPL